MRHTTLTRPRFPRPARTVLALAAAALAIPTLQGCVIGAAIGGMAESYRRTGKTLIEAQYEGIEGKSFAVVTIASRSIEAEHPGLTSRITRRVNDRLIQNANPAYAIPSNDLLRVLYNTPTWRTMTREDLAELLGVERLIVIELIDYRLHEPGNRHLWDGRIAGVVSVYEADSALPNDPIYEKALSMTFPDSSGYLRSDIPEAAVTSELSNRFINRAAWLFYDHEEPNAIAY